MTWPRAATALLGLWILAGAGIEALHWHRQALDAAARRHAVTKQNYAKAAGFVDACLRGHPAMIDNLMYDCSHVRLMQLPARVLRNELAYSGD